MDKRPKHPVPKGVSKVLNKLSYGIVGFAFAFICLLTYWSFEPDVVYDVKQDNITVLTDPVQPGGVVRVQFSYCKVLKSEGTVTRIFVSERTEILTPSFVDRAGVGCVKDFEVDIPVPPQIGPGTYRVKYVVRYRVNPIKTIHQEAWTEPFQVIEAKEQ